ncbi:methyl-accepting chemotaxis sensory transducer [Desulfobacula toluolica Tol2]|uniref:Methyl-accepting chemotaxis sensory transducer n=1 Tax=Desulfobacula toluolica (strain DSM 7467 / Tol2) TaxID=651182 RepID=K0NL16_DESTT|nr:methyl-accepting chemotaxis sensory transducer [Desulfobacula toluolica Tol2]
MNLSIGKKMGLNTLIFSLVAIVPFVILGVMAVKTAQQSFVESKFEQLSSVRSIKKGQIEKFFKEREGDMGVLVETVSTLRQEAFAKLVAVQEIKKQQLMNYVSSVKGALQGLKGDPYVQKAVMEFATAFAKAGNKTESSEWKSAALEYHPRLKNIMEGNGWYDMFLIGKQGNIIYTVMREADLGMNIPGSELKNQGMGKIFTYAKTMGKDEIAIADFEPYSPSNGKPAGFMMAQIHDDFGNLQGYVALQIPLDRINQIMLVRDGMGKTGESYLVGQDGLMRSDSYLDPQGHSVEASFQNKKPVKTEAVKDALQGNTNHKVIVDYNGNPVLSAWSRVELGNGVYWAMISEIDVAEAFSPVDADGNEFYAKYKELYGYYDLFLFNPDGYAFYTVTRESDYQTNFLNGKYSRSNLGTLIQQVVQSKQFGLADFAPYAPSNGEPCAFIAQPLIHNGQVEIIVALQLSLESINSIMQEREGLGKTGETYLVGSDHLMRSDSFLDPASHSVKASFANPGKGSIKTMGVTEALSGKTGNQIIMDYNDTPVLSAYTPVTIGNTTWALLAEIDQKEVVTESVAAQILLNRVWMIGLVSILVIAAVIIMSIFIVKNLSQTLSRVIAGLSSSTEQVASAAGQVSSSSQSLAEGSSEQAASIEETSASMEEMASMTAKNAENAAHADTLMKEANGVVASANNSMNQLISSMEDISRASDETGKIIKTIDEIAFQTNLLALNAAVEAARAGDAGAGFAVVADEVRNLAIRSAEAAKNTAQLIEGTVKKVNHGSELVSTTNEAFGNVAKSSEKVAGLVAEISEASKEQSGGIEQVNIAITEMDKVVQQNAATAEESASASEEMNAQAEQLKDYVGDLVLLVTGKNEQRSAALLHQKSVAGISGTSRRSMPANKKLIAPLKEVRPDQVIPFDDDKEFVDF